MASSIASEPDQSGLIIYVGQDRAGRWLVQDSMGHLEGRFVSCAAAMSYARAEREVYNAELAIASEPLVPLVPFVAVSAHERAIARVA